MWSSFGFVAVVSTLVQYFKVPMYGPVPFDPNFLDMVPADKFREQLNADGDGSTKNVVVAHSLPPIDYQSPLFSEDDDRFDLKLKPKSAFPCLVF